MIISRISPLTQKENSLDLPITQEQINRWEGGELIQRVMPHLSADEREFLINGLYPGEFEQIFGEEEP